MWYSEPNCTVHTESGELHSADIKLKDMSCGIWNKLTVYWFSRQCVILNNACNMKNYYFSLVIPTMHILNLCNSRNTCIQANFTVSDSNEYIPALKTILTCEWWVGLRWWVGAITTTSSRGVEEGISGTWRGKLGNEGVNTIYNVIRKMVIIVEKFVLIFIGKGFFNWWRYLNQKLLWY